MDAQSCGVLKIFCDLLTQTPMKALSANPRRNMVIYTLYISAYGMMDNAKRSALSSIAIYNWEYGKTHPR